MRQQLDLIVSRLWEEIVTEEGRQHLRSALTEMLRAYFQKVASQQGDKSHAKREDSC